MRSEGGHIIPTLLEYIESKIRQMPQLNDSAAAMICSGDGSRPGTVYSCQYDAMMPRQYRDGGCTQDAVTKLKRLLSAEYWTGRSALQQTAAAAVRSLRAMSLRTSPAEAVTD